MTRGSRLIFAAGLPLLAGCYTYAVTPVERVPVGAAVRAQLSSEESQRIGQALGGGVGRSLRGELLELGSDSLLLGVTRNIGSAGMSPRRAEQRVRIPRSEVFELEVRRLSRWRTAALVAAGAIATYVLIETDFGGLASGGSGGNKGAER